MGLALRLFDLALVPGDNRHALLARVYPPPGGIDGTYMENSRHLAEQRLVDAGRRLAIWLESLLARRVSRETAGRPQH